MEKGQGRKPAPWLIWLLGAIFFTATVVYAAQALLSPNLRELHIVLAAVNLASAIAALALYAYYYRLK